MTEERDERPTQQIRVVKEVVSAYGVNNATSDDSGAKSAEETRPEPVMDPLFRGARPKRKR